MRLAQLHRLTSRLNGGIFFAQTGVTPYLAHAGGPTLELRVIGGRDPHSEADRPHWAPAVVESLPFWPPGSFAFSPRWQPALAAFAPDVMHSHGLWAFAGWAALRHHRRYGTPFVVSPHGMLDPWALQFSRQKKRVMAVLFQKAQLNAAAAVQALTVAEAQSIAAYGVRSPIIIVPNGVDLPQPMSRPPPWPGDPMRDRTLLFLGRLHPKKGLVPLLDAWMAFKASRPESARWRLVLGGWSELGFEAQLRARIAGSPAAESVAFIAPLWGEEKHAAYASADAIILPSHSEGLPMTVLEAWSHAKPALITAACNLPEGVAAGAAWQIEATTESIAAGLLRLAQSPPETLRAMGQAGRRLVETRFTWPKIAADFLRVYRAVAARQLMPSDLLYRGG